MGDHPLLLQQKLSKNVVVSGLTGLGAQAAQAATRPTKRTRQIFSAGRVE